MHLNFIPNGNGWEIERTEGLSFQIAGNSDRPLPTRTRFSVTGTAEDITALVSWDGERLADIELRSGELLWIGVPPSGEFVDVARDAMPSMPGATFHLHLTHATRAALVTRVVDGHWAMADEDTLRMETVFGELHGGMPQLIDMLFGGVHLNRLIAAGQLLGDPAVLSQLHWLSQSPQWKDAVRPFTPVLQSLSDVMQLMVELPDNANAFLDLVYS